MPNIKSQGNSFFVQLGYLFGVCNLGFIGMIIYGFITEAVSGFIKLEINSFGWKLMLLVIVHLILVSVSLPILFLSNQEKRVGSRLWSIIQVVIICLIFIITYIHGAIFNGDINF